MPYDAQGRWIEENEWEQMMREQAAQRVQAFSRYNAAPPSLYPNQAAPYGSFPYVDPTPAIWDSSPERLRQDVPADPKYQGWDFNQEPIADTSAISNVPFAGLQTVSGTQSMEDILANAQKSQGVKTDIQNLIEMYGDPSTEVTDDPYAAPVSDPNIVTSGPLVPDQSRWDMLPAVPGTGDAIPMPNMEVDQPIATGIIPAGVSPQDSGMVSVGTNAFGIPDKTYGPMTETVPVTDPSLQGVTPTSMAQAGFTTGGAFSGGPGNIDHLGNVFSVQNKNKLDLGPLIMPSYSGTGTGSTTIPIGVPVFPGLTLGLTGAAATAKAISDSEGVQPGEPYSGMGDAPDLMSTGHPGMMGATGYDLSGAGMSVVPNIQTSAVTPDFPHAGATTVDDMIARQDVSWAGQPSTDIDYSRMFYNDMYGTTQEVLDDMARVEQERQDALDAVAAANVDDFSDMPVPAPVRRAPPVVPAYTGPTKAELQAAAAAQRKADLARQKAAAKAKRDLDKLKAKQDAADKNRIAKAAQEATRRSLEKQMQGWLGRDERDESAMAQIQAALDHIADLQGTGVTSGSTGDRSGEVRDAMRSVGYGGPEWT